MRKHVDYDDPELDRLNKDLIQSYEVGRTHETLYALGKMNLHTMVNIIENESYESVSSDIRYRHLLSKPTNTLDSTAANFGKPIDSTQTANTLDRSR